MPDRGPGVRPGRGERPPFAAVLRPPVGGELAAAAEPELAAAAGPELATAAEPELAAGCRSGGAGGAVTPAGLTAPRAPVRAVRSRPLA